MYICAQVTSDFHRRKLETRLARQDLMRRKQLELLFIIYWSLVLKRYDSNCKRLLESSFAYRGAKFQRPSRKAKIREKITAPPPQKYLSIFLCFPFLCKNIMITAAHFFLVSSLKNMRCRSKACSSCRKISTLVSTEGLE